MKLHFDIDCTPEEARRFFGFPDVAPLQEKLLAELEEKLRRQMREADVETLMRQWMPSGMREGFDNLDAFRRMFWPSAGGKAGSSADRSNDG